MPQVVVAIACILLALIPVAIWGYIFLKRHPETHKLVLYTFIGGIVAVVPLLIYKLLWQYFPWINAFKWTRGFDAELFGFTTFMLIPISVLLTFMLVGVIEEISKILVVKFVDKKRFLSIDDAIELSIVAALGFAFVENVIYFYNIATIRGLDDILLPFVFRSVFSTFAHVMFSGIFGYYYGVAHFATPIFQEEMVKNRHPFINYFHKVFHIRRPVLFHHEKIVEGFFVATALHAFFNILLEMEWTFLLLPFTLMGYLTLTYLLRKKENLKKYGKLSPVRTSE